MFSCTTSTKLKTFSISIKIIQVKPKKAWKSGLKSHIGYKNSTDQRDYKRIEDQKKKFKVNSWVGR